jgi:hypothetical protein
MKQEFKIIADNIENNTRVLDVWLWGWCFNRILKTRKKY